MSQGQEGFIPRFSRHFLAPKYWGIWLGVLLLIILAFLPVKFRDRLLSKVGHFIGRKAKSARKRASANLLACFPEKTDEEREIILEDMFAVILPVTVMLVDIAIKKSSVPVVWHGFEHINNLQKAERNIILLVPHGWGIDIPAILLAMQGHAVAAMFHHQSNDVVDYLWNKARLIFGGRLHARDDGVKPFVQSVRNGYIGYYLPDEDHGPEHSIFVDFFATYKATLPVLSRLIKLCRADVLPVFPVYDLKTSTFHVYIRPPMSDLVDQDDEYVARRMNEEVELLVTPNPEQYAWVLRFLKTRRSGDKSIY